MTSLLHLPPKIHQPRQYISYTNLDTEPICHDVAFLCRIGHRPRTYCCFRCKIACFPAPYQKSVQTSIGSPRRQVRLDMRHRHLLMHVFRLLDPCGPTTAQQLVCAEVTSIRLPNNTLTGSLPSSFSDLPLQVSPCFASGANTCLVWPGQNEDGIHCLCMPLGSQACSPTPPSPCQPTSLCAYTSSKRAPDQVLDVSTNAMSGHLDVLAPLTGLYELHTSNNVSLLCFGCGCLP